MTKIFGFFILLFLSLSSWAWGSVGHHLIAQIAYDNVKPAVQKKLDQSLHAGDRVYPATTFMQASSFADQLRIHNVHAYDPWHYIDLDYNDPKFLSNQNVVWAILESSTILSARGPNAFEKSFFLRFLIHFVGDIHQPMHCIERAGDRGGNLFFIQSYFAHNLHAYWDAGAGLFVQKDLQSAESIKTFARALEKRYPKAYFGKRLALQDPKQWAYESYAIAKKFAYALPAHTRPSKQYQKEAEAQVMQQITLAGYRLALLLNKNY